MKNNKLLYSTSTMAMLLFASNNVLGTSSGDISATVTVEDPPAACVLTVIENINFGSIYTTSDIGSNEATAKISLNCTNGVSYKITSGKNNSPWPTGFRVRYLKNPDQGIGIPYHISTTSDFSTLFDSVDLPANDIVDVGDNTAKEYTFYAKLLGYHVITSSVVSNGTIIYGQNVGTYSGVVPIAVVITN